MSEVLDQRDTLVEPEIAPEPELPEQRFEYQPTDATGRPIGAKQVIKYKTQDDLNKFWQEQNTLLVRKLREETRKNRLGITDDEEIGAEAPRHKPPIEFKKRELSPDERVKLSRDMLDPERFDDAFDMALEARLGAKPDDIVNTLTRQQEQNLQLLAKIETDAFLQANPQYYKCQENYEAITGWMVKRNLEPVRENFQLAYDTLKSLNVMVEGPTPHVPVPDPPPAEVPLDRPPTVRLPSGLTKGQATDTGNIRTIGDDVTYELVDPYTKQRRLLKGMAAINAMPADEFKKRVNSDPTFSAKVDQLEREAAQLRAGR